MPEYPLVSIITPLFNQDDHSVFYPLLDCLRPARGVGVRGVGVDYKSPDLQ